jgi:hypothetical protein
MTDPIVQRIEAFRSPRGQLRAVRQNRGYTLYSADTGTRVARLRATAQEDRVEVLYWSHWKEAWTGAGPLGRAALSVDRALEFITADDIFWTDP